MNQAERAIRFAEQAIKERDDRIQQLEEDNARLLREGINGFLDSGHGSDMNEALDRLLRKSEKRIQHLEEAIEKLRSSFEARMERAAKLVDEGELNDYWRGNRDALQVCLAKLAALSSSASEATRTAAELEKEGEDG